MSLITQAGIVVSRDRVTRADGHVSPELTMHEVGDGLIENIWYLACE